MARVLVTGGAGFLGSHLVEELLARNHAVVAVDDLFRGKQKHLEDCKGSLDFHFLKGDCADLQVLRNACFEDQMSIMEFRDRVQNQISDDHDQE